MMSEAARDRRLLRSPSILLAAALATGTGLSMGLSIVPETVAAASPTSLCGAYASAEFGPNVCVFTPPSGAGAASELAAIQTVVNNIATQQVPLSAQFNDSGYALLFEPGTYGSATTPLVFEVGYYTQVAGLGAVPQDTTINGQIEVFPNALDCASATNCWANSTVNFWRSMSNLTLNVMDSANNYVPQPITQQPPIGDSADCYGGPTDMWSVSQATPVRSVIINGTLNFQAYCSQTNYGSNDFGSGSYVANTEINGQLDWSGNQQGIARNSDFESAAGYVWNYVYSGDACPPGYTPSTTKGAPGPAACAPTVDAFDGTSAITNGTDGIYGVDQVTELPQSPVTEEEPFLYTSSTGSTSSTSSASSASSTASDWNAFVPAVQHNSVGPNFLSGTEAGTTVALSSFFVANPGTPEIQIQSALDHGDNLILTPGVYDLNAPLRVSHPGSVVMGLGFPVLVPQRGNASMVVTPNNGVKLSAMIFDAGPVNSPVLVSVGTPSPGHSGLHGPKANSANDPDLIQDIYFRIGGAESTAVSATVSLLDNADNSIIDDVWAWRADHGSNTSVTGPEGEQGAGWTYNQGDTGLVVTGDNVTAYGLAVEHYQKNEVIWSGDNGTEIFFQNELPYDPPSQTAWDASPVQPGYPSFLVTNDVNSFHSYGMGSYVVFIDTPATLWDAMAYEAPNEPGVVFTDAMDLFISSTCSVNGNCHTPSQSGGLDSVIDGVGGPATFANVTSPVDVLSYSEGNAVLPNP
ncbi:MAG: adenylyl cyclase [Acidimicrobiales bacterium]